MERDISRHEEIIMAHLKKAHNACDFHRLADMQYASANVFDEAYKLLSDIDISLSAIERALLRAENERDMLIDQRNSCDDKIRKKNISKEIDSLASLRKQLFSEKDQIMKQRNELSGTIKCLH